MASVRPSTLGELQLYKVLQRANLLSYYEAFISQGGDDVQQLCEAGEEEFLEIMALVGMACKPLHVRRLQKALQEWVTRPAIFRNTNMHYLPAQSISLTSLGIDTRDLVVPHQNSPRNTTSPTLAHDTNVETQEDNIINRPLSVGGSAATTPKPLNGVGNVFRLDENTKKLNGASDAADSVDEIEAFSDASVSSFMDTIVQKYIQSPIPLPEKMNAIAQLQADRSLGDLAIAIENENRLQMESLIKDFVKTQDAPSSRIESLRDDAAVKLCMSDVRWLVKKKELFTTAETIANEVHSKVTSRRRPSAYLHGSSYQSRIEEIDRQLQNIKGQRTSTNKKLADAQLSKNVIKENECQNVLGCLAKDETVLFQEKRELSKKLQAEINQTAPASSGVESSFSSELAGYYNSDLAKAHNLSFGNLQPSTSSWKLVENGVSNTRKSPEVTRSSANHGAVSHGNVSSDGKSSQSSEGATAILMQVKKESDEDDDAFPSKTNGVLRPGKRKLSSGNASGEANNSKKILTSVDSEV